MNLLLMYSHEDARNTALLLQTIAATHGIAAYLPSSSDSDAVPSFFDATLGIMQNGSPSKEFVWNFHYPRPTAVICFGKRLDPILPLRSDFGGHDVLYLDSGRPYEVSPGLWKCWKSVQDKRVTSLSPEDQIRAIALSHVAIGIMLLNASTVLLPVEEITC